MLELQHLKIVAAIAETESVTAAAERLCLTQSAVSHALKRLESRAGTPLLERRGRSAVLTRAGQYLAKVAERLLPQCEQAERRLLQYATGTRGELRIGMECHPCFKWLARLMPRFLGEWPDVDVDVLQRFRFGGLAALLAGEIDVLVTPDPVWAAPLHFERALPYEQVLVVAATHRLAAQTAVTPAQLRGEILLTYPVALERLDIYNQFLQPAGLYPSQHKTVETTEMLLQLVAAGRGVTALPAWLVSEHQQDLPLATLRLGETGIHKHIHLGVRREDLALDFVQGLLAAAQLPGRPSTGAE